MSVSTRTSARRLALCAHQLRSFNNCLHFSERNFAGQILHAAIRRDDDAFGLDVGQRAADPLRHDLRRFDCLVIQIDYAEQNLLICEL